MVEHSAFNASQVQENDIGVVVLQIPFGVQNFYPRRSVPVHFRISRVFNKTPGSFFLLHDFSCENKLELYQAQVTGLFRG